MAANRLRVTLSYDTNTDLTRAEEFARHVPTEQFLRDHTGIAWNLTVTVLEDLDGRANQEIAHLRSEVARHESYQVELGGTDDD